MKEILVLGGGASGLAAAIAAAQTGGGRVRVTLLEQNPAPGKKLLATGNGRCNFDNLASSEPGRYFTAAPGALAGLLAAIDGADLPAWWEELGLLHRADEAGRLYPYSNQAADLTGLLLGWLEALGVSVQTGCRVLELGQKGRSYAVQAEREGKRQLLTAQNVICALGGSAGPQFGTGGFGPALARRAGGRVEPLYPCLTPLRCGDATLLKPLAGLRARGAVSLWEGSRLLAREEGEIQFAEYGLSGICVMQLSGLLAPGRGPQDPAVSVDLFPQWEEEALAGFLAARGGGKPALPFWQGMLDRRLGDALWKAAGLSGRLPAQLVPGDWRRLTHTCKAWRFGGLSLCGWKQAQTTGGGLSLEELEPDFQFRGCPGLYVVGETLDCAGSCGGFNLHWAFGSGVVAGRSAARHR
ncbi:MAG TPA: aminoacetone oxidase family FAD-binding enzyme [Candidatus Faecalibacterium gallistercoris]|uniref:Aminoacetone oxidase family FAD-binding enzyme n=1 Tax=Candidatus Faecalibacterium gallistercoris TaxID=2838579 RepID=A0A9D2FGE5_9FIRM|nr:aminoacetone oxidase family FAD-binding enzyme [Candidatus Faecalibacterium gallistercoris]